MNARPAEAVPPLVNEKALAYAHALREAADAIDPGDVPCPRSCVGDCPACTSRADAKVLRRMADAAGKDTSDGNQPTAGASTQAAPSRFFATPLEIMRHLREHFAEDAILRLQQAIGDRAVFAAVVDQRIQAATLSVTGAPLPEYIQRGWRDAADHVDPDKGGGPYPSRLLTFEAPGGEPS